MTSRRKGRMNRWTVVVVKTWVLDRVFPILVVLLTMY